MSYWCLMSWKPLRQTSHRPSQWRIKTRSYCNGLISLIITFINFICSYHSCWIKMNCYLLSIIELTNALSKYLAHRCGHFEYLLLIIFSDRPSWKNQNKNSKFDTYKLMCYQGHKYRMCGKPLPYIFKVFFHYLLSSK